MNVAETTAIAREWIERHGNRLPGYRDVDIAIVSSEGKKDDACNVEIAYQGVIIECGFYDAGQYGSAEALLADPGLAPHLAVNSVLHDLHGLLRAVAFALALRL